MITRGDVNSLRPSDAGSWSSFFGVMACHMFSVKAFPDPMLSHCQLDLREQMSLKLQNQTFFLGNAFENVFCKMMVILSRSVCVNVGDFWLIWLIHHVNLHFDDFVQDCGISIVLAMKTAV